MGPFARDTCSSIVAKREQLMKTLRPCLAEFLGTFYLCFAGIGAILCNTPAVGGMSGLLGIALAHGLALSIAVNVFGGESGAFQSSGHRRISRDRPDRPAAGGGN